MPALRRSQDNDAKAKKESVVERTSRAAMVKVTELRRKERRQNGRNRLQRPLQL